MQLSSRSCAVRSPKQNSQPSQLQINRRWQENTRKTSTSRNHINPTVPKGAVRYIVGKGKKRMKEVEDNCNVTLTISLPKQWSDEQTATITGPEEGVNMAANEVINIVEQYNEDQDKYAKRERETKDIPCKFYQEGKCKHGNKCDYAHSKRQHSSRSHSPSTHHRQESRPYTETKRLMITKRTRSHSPLYRKK